LQAGEAVKDILVLCTDQGKERPAHAQGRVEHEKTAAARALQLQWQHLTANQLKAHFCTQVVGAYGNTDGNELM